MSEPKPKRTVELPWLALAGCGAALAWDGWQGGGTGLHRIAAYALGAVLAVPLGVRVLLGRRVNPWLGRLGLVVVTLAVTLVLAEVALRLANVRVFESSELVRDPRLGHRLIPGRGGLDAWGFHNVSIPERAAVVVLGDSQTYGTNLGLAETYPSQLQVLLGTPVVNLGLGGYGPIQWMALCERALSLEPDTLVIGLYFGNDLLDAHRFAGLEAWSSLRDPALGYPSDPGAARPNKPAPNLTMAALDGLFAHSSMAGGAAEALKRRMRLSPLFGDLQWQEANAPSWTEGRIATHFTPRYRLPAVDLELPAVRDGLRILGECLGSIVELSAASETRVLVLLLPTKERCYADLALTRSLALHPDLERLHAAEVDATRRVLELLDALTIEHVDPTSAILAELQADRPVWPPHADGHFNPAGALLLARCLQERLQ